MQDYTIEVVTPQVVNLQQELQSAYDDGAAGSFRLFPQEDGVKIIFDREYTDDAEMIEPRMGQGKSLQQAVCEQLADEFEESGSPALAPVVEALRTTAIAFDGKGLPFSAYVGFVPAEAELKCSSPA